MNRPPRCTHKLQLQLTTSNPSSSIGWRHSYSNMPQWQPPLYNLVGVSAVRGGIGSSAGGYKGMVEDSFVIQGSLRNTVGLVERSRASHRVSPDTSHVI
jgi:hypothetical protein